jgi:hypothetical protein
MTKKQIRKKYIKKCFFCEEDNYNLLDAHRIIPGEQGGKYHNLNILVTCANCHRRCHSGEIKVDRKYQSSAGIVVHFWQDGVEYWKPEVNTV